MTLPSVQAVVQNRLAPPLPSVILLDRFGNKAVGGAEEGVWITALEACSASSERSACVDGYSLYAEYPLLSDSGCSPNPETRRAKIRTKPEA